MRQKVRNRSLRERQERVRPGGKERAGGVLRTGFAGRLRLAGQADRRFKNPVAVTNRTAQRETRRRSDEGHSG
jgi:hypothetical protein